MIKIERPRFLTILCLLSFIGGLWTIKTSVQDLFFADEFDTESANYELRMENNGELPSFFENMMNRSVDFYLLKEEHALILNSSALILSIIALIGVYFMYTLKKKGFVWYLVPQLLMVAIPFFYFLGNSVGQLFIAGQFFITALFIFMYATQLKYMHQ